MCGRYFLDQTIEKDLDLLPGGPDSPVNISSFYGDIHPSETAPILCRVGGQLSLIPVKWGFKGKNDQLLINARCESALQKPTFSQSVLTNRCIIPASGFYEWNRLKEMSIFAGIDQAPLYMAGSIRGYDDGLRFTILTTAANESMLPVHDRMPLIIERENIMDWIFDDGCTADFLSKTPPLLKRTSDYEQMSLWI